MMPIEESLARIALGCIGREYPNHVAHVLMSDADALPPRRLTPAFYGCFDWHSAVHGHWCLVRLMRRSPDAAWTAAARAAVAANLTTENLAGEAAYLRGPGREGFERPYGLAWLLQLAAELREWEDTDARRWQRDLEPLECLAVERFTRWLPKLTHPIRSGEHSQTAFAMGLALDAARTAGHREFADVLVRRSLDFYYGDQHAPLAYEPSGHDFLSPALAEADLMRRVLPSAEFAAWLGGFLPELPHDGAAAWLVPAASPDPSDGKLAHLDGLNLSRAWMLEGIAAGLPPDDPRIATLRAAAATHRAAGLPAVSDEFYAGAHWLASFAAYLITGRGLPQRP